MSKLTHEQIYRAPEGTLIPSTGIYCKLTKRADGRWQCGETSINAEAIADFENRVLIYPDDVRKPPATILTEAQDTISTSRQADYGDAQVSFKRIADLWSTYLGQDVSAQDVACLMALMKISRIKGDPSKRDSWVDLAGYAGLGGELK